MERWPYTRLFFVHHLGARQFPTANDRTDRQHGSNHCRPKLEGDAGAVIRGNAWVVTVHTIQTVGSVHPKCGRRRLIV